MSNRRGEKSSVDPKDSTRGVSESRTHPKGKVKERVDDIVV